ncbi:MAG: S41 family peptidase [Vicinamibacterales bacterium]
MTSRTRWLVFLVSTPLVALIAVGGILGASPAAQQAFPHLRIFHEVESLVYGAYVEEVDPDRVMDGAMRGLADSLDSASAYLTPAEVSAIDAGTKTPPAQVGLVVTRQYYLRVVGVRDDSPAARAGIRSGDLIRMIDGQASRDISAPAGMRMLAGAPGTTVSLLVIRDNAADPHEITLTREVPKTDLAVGRTLAGGEAYVRVHSFAPGATAAIRKAVDGLKPKGGVILDLRDVADGPASEAIAAARLFVGTGTIATLAERGDARTETKAAAGDGALAMPVVLLTSNGTANAAEVFAAALKGHDRATLVGQPTAGLAAEQHLVRLPEGHGLWLTYARYLAADGTPIHENGLVPDVAVPVPFVGFGEEPPPGDPVLDKGVEQVRQGKSGAGSGRP